MVMTNWSRDNINSMILSWLNNNFNDFAVGTDSTAEDSSQTSLGNEVFRKSISDKVQSSNSLVYRCYVAKTEANGNNLCEVGIFDSNNNMLLREVFGTVQKTQDIDLWIEVEVSIIIS